MPFYDILVDDCHGEEESSDRIYLGTAYGKNFEDACRNYADTVSAFGDYFDESAMTYKGCKLTCVVYEP